MCSARLSAREAVRRMSTGYGGAGAAIVNVSSVAARLGLHRGPLRIELRGGELEVEAGDRTLLRGPATEVFRGEWPIA